MSTALKVSNLTKTFGFTKAVDEASFEANSGEIFGLLGPNGAGKTTTIRVVSSILSPTSGTAEVEGFDIKKDSAKVRDNIAVLTTETGVYERFTGRENLTYFGNLYGIFGEKLGKRISELSKLLEMDWFLDKRAGGYSTGMKQKMAIARSVIHDPKVLIFDEPTTGLDVLASLTVLDFMKKAKKAGKCVVLSTHQMPDAEKLCDRVCIMHQGKVLLVDSVVNIEKQTEADNLEDAFLNIIKKRNLEVPQEKYTEQKKTGFPLIDLIRR